MGVGGGVGVLPHPHKYFPPLRSRKEAKIHSKATYLDFTLSLLPSLPFVGPYIVSYSLISLSVASVAGKNELTHEENGL